MNEKHRKLLEYLFRQRECVTAGRLAEIFGVSSRTIKTYVKDINEQYRQELIVSSKNGYMLDKTQAKCALDMAREEEIPQDFEERCAYLIKRLLIGKKERLDLFDISEEICIEYQTLSNDVYRMNRIYREYRVKFSVKKGFLYIEGGENAKRRLLADVIREETKEHLITEELLAQLF